MQELRLVAVSEDGTYAVLAVPGRGGRFVLPIDDRLRTVARGQFSRLAQYEIEVENPLRPKEIQDRIRAGETADEIADAAGIPIDRVRRFEGPVLAEREYRAQEAQRSTVRGHTESGPGPRLGEIVAERLADADAPSDTLAWDSRKRADGNWQVQLQFTLEHRPQLAEWVFDPRRRHVYPADDLARRLCLPEADWPAGRLGSLGAPSATVTPIGSRLGAHHADSRPPEGDRSESRTEPDRALARGAHAAPAAPAHAPWSREAREPGWARETPTVPVPAARPADPARPDEPGRSPAPGAAAPASPGAHASGSARVQEQPRAEAARAAESAAGTAPAGDSGRAPALSAQPGASGASTSPATQPPATQTAAAQPPAAQPPATQTAAAQPGMTRPQAASQPAASAPAAASGDAARGSASGPAQSTASAPAEASDAGRPAEPEAPARAGRKAGRNRRSSVPSWDEIMLGNSRQPD
jgi:Protein of unknown function (DUF3071)